MAVKAPVQIGYDEDGRLYVRVLKSLIKSGATDAGDYWEYRTKANAAAAPIDFLGVDDDQGCKSLQLNVGGKVITK
jgi:hypothetical protein